MREKMLTVSEAAEYLGVKVATIYQYTHYGKLHPKKFARCSRFNESELRNMLDDAFHFDRSETVTIDSAEFLKSLEGELTDNQIQIVKKSMTACATSGSAE